MKNEKFWNKCTENSIRQKVAEFIDKDPAVSHLKGEAYYDFEDAFVAFIYENRDMISKEVNLEYQREDFITQAKEEFGDEIEEAIKVFPIEIIDNIVNAWQDSLSNNDMYWEIIWENLSHVLSDNSISIFAGINDYPHEKALLYLAYLKEWYSNGCYESQKQIPHCIDDFFSNEMQDKDLSEYYVQKANLFFGQTNK